MNEQLDSWKKALLVNKGKWPGFSAQGNVRDLIQEFEAAGGSAGLLKFLWDSFEAPPPRAAGPLWESMMKDVKSLERLCAALRDYDNCPVDDLAKQITAVKKSVNVGMTFTGPLKGNQAEWKRHYWIGALAPYLDLVAKKPNWVWLASWASEVEGAEIDENQLRGFSTAVKKRQLLYWDNPPANGSFDLLHEHLAGLSMEGRRDLAATGYGVLNTALWIRRSRKPAKLGRFIKKAHGRLPFLKLILPNASFLRRAT